ncbi:branched-chain amino acid ABC transporter permease [Acidisoma cellulosilytica]|uniref:Branched-chain amino acid ABC transporter permease n=1 Tax=Acidisoma cellulosilyticum TaxID=2802395 RepID=A0A963Z7Y5_9PROT|nr:branched-chain amino acid ABC transporter permease [Acidisoma cellulosilyticum]MCB8883715.1 branched-chain amino acid ABC transporter permease [Acidisoma cellulosilyticum]
MVNFIKDRSSRWTLPADAWIGLLVIIIAVAVPFVIQSRYLLGEVILALIWAGVASQWNLLFGYAGVFSLAPMAFFAFGAYATAMLSYYLGWSVWLSIPAGAIVSIPFSLIIGLACLRLEGVYVALLTFAVAQMMYLLIVTDTGCFQQIGGSCVQFTGGATGFSDFGDFGMRPLLHQYWMIGNYAVVCCGAFLTMLVSWIVIRSPMGLAFRAIRDNPGYAMARGVNRFRTHLLVFGISAFFIGLLGGLYAVHFQAIGPTVFSLSQLLFVIASVVVGGVGSFWGPLLGAVVLTGADEFLSDFGEYRSLGLGLIITAFVVFLPRGLVGEIVHLFALWRRKRQSHV